MIHVLLTPPDLPQDLDTIGILQIGCVPDWADAIFVAMANEGWTVTQILNPMAVFPDAAPERTRGQGYIGQFLLDHPHLDPLKEA